MTGHSHGEKPVKVRSEKVLLTSTLCPVGQKWEQVERFFARMCGCKVLNADEKSSRGVGVQNDCVPCL